LTVEAKSSVLSTAGPSRLVSADCRFAPARRGPAIGKERLRRWRVSDLSARARSDNKTKPPRGHRQRPGATARPRKSP